MYLVLKTTVSLEDEYNSFTRPIIYDSVRSVLEFYGLSSTARIYYNGNNEISKLVGSDSTDAKHLDIHTDGIYEDKLFVAAEVEQSEFNSGYANQRRTPTERPIWMNLDQEQPIAIYPAFEGSRVEVTVTALFNSLSKAQAFVKKTNRLQSNQVVDFSFSPIAHLPLPNSILELLEDLHGMYQANDPTTEPLGDWFNKHAKAPLTVIKNVAGNHERIVAPMKLVDIGIIFTEPTLERARKGSTYGRYEVSIKYHFYLNSIINWELEYPLNIYQDEIPSKWIPRTRVEHKTKREVRTNQETSYALVLTKPIGISDTPVLKLPEHDNWSMPNRRLLGPILQARLKLKDLEEQVLVGNLFDIPGFNWNPLVKEYLLDNKHLVFQRHSCLFPVMFFSNNTQVDVRDLSLDENGTITLTRSPVMKNTYRLVIGADLAIRELNDDFWESIRDKPKYIELVEQTYDWYDWKSVKNEDWYYNPDGSINFDELIDRITKDIDLNGPGGGFRPKEGAYNRPNFHNSSLTFHAHKILDRI